MDHYFSKKPQSSTDEKIIDYSFGSHHLSLITSASLFSKDHVDKGSDLLIRECDLSSVQSVLDIGCGYGPVGISLLKKNPQLAVMFSDVNQRALEITKRNLKRNKVKGEVVESNLFENITDSFDTILTNPPQHAGKSVCMSLIEQSYDHLNSSGSLQLVCRKQKGGAALAAHMKEIFGNCEIIGRQSGFSLFKSIKS